GGQRRQGPRGLPDHRHAARGIFRQRGRARGAGGSDMSATMNMNLDFIALHAGARLVGESAAITGVSTDSRRIGAGELFVALSGPRFDGHDFIAQAADAGAAALLVEREVDSQLPQLVVDDTLAASARL